MVKENFKELPELFQNAIRMKYERDKSLIEKFCRKYDVKLMEVRSTITKNRFGDFVKPMYFFNDTKGAYTKESLEASLKE